MRIALTLLAACLLAATPLARAQADYPNKPIRLVVGFAAGGISDVLGRALAAKLSANVGQSVLVENKSGAGHHHRGRLHRQIGAGWLHAVPAGTSPRMPSMPVSMPSCPTIRVRDFTPVGLVASTPLMLVVHPSTNVKTVKELVGMLKASPGKYSLWFLGQRHHPAPGE